MTRPRCEVCKKEITEYHVKIDGKYYHYSPCCIERFKTRTDRSAPTFTLETVDRAGVEDLPTPVGGSPTHNLFEAEGYSLSCSLFPTLGSYRNRLGDNIREDSPLCDQWSRN
jgi:hypothetical protein